MALCSGLAAVTLTFGTITAVPVLSRRLATIRIPVPVRPVAVLLMVLSTTAILSRPGPADATVSPPIVRLVDEQSDPAEDGELPGVGAEGTPEASTPVQFVQTERVGVLRVGADSDAYVVESGDSLWRIAATVLRSNGDGDPSSASIARFWPEIYEANMALIGDNPNLIFPGQRLLIPEV